MENFRLNLAKYEATSFTLSLETQLDADIIQRLREIAGREDDLFSFISSYRIGNNYHRVNALVHPIGEEAKKLHVILIYSLIPRGAKRKGREKRPEEEKAFQLLETLSKLEHKQTFDCDASFTYKNAKNKSIVQLPWALFRGSGMPFNQIGGLRLQQRTQNEVEYEIIVEFSENDLIHAVFFSGKAKISAELLDELLRKTDTISRKFLLKE